MKKNITGLLVTAVSLFFIYSCSKIDTTDLGNDLIPAVDNVNTFDTLIDIQTDNLLFTNDATQMPYNLDHAIGIIENDPDFGGTNAALYFDVSPAAFKAYPFTNKDSVVSIDSVVLSLAYKSLYGDSNSIEKFDVFEIDQSADFRFLDSGDYEIDANDFPVVPTPIGSRTFDFKILNDSVHYVNGTDTVRTTNELRIHINPSFATRFVNADTTNAYSNDSIFKTYLKGLAVKASSTGSPQKTGLAYFDITDAKSKVTFYYKAKQNGNTNRLASSFRYFNSNGTANSTIGAQANIIRRTPSNGYLASVSNANPNDPVLYIQSTPGSYATIKIPGLSGLSNRVIHRAELAFPRLTPISETFSNPDLLFIDLVNPTADTIFTIPNDFVRTGNNTYDINLIGGRINDNKYTFNISRHVQNIVTNKRLNYTLRLHAPFITRPYILEASGDKSPIPFLFLINPTVAKGRVILAGGSHPTNKVQLRIIYSKI